MPDRRRIFKHYLIVFESLIDRNLDEPAPSRLPCWHVLFDMIDFEFKLVMLDNYDGLFVRFKLAKVRAISYFYKIK